MNPDELIKLFHLESVSSGSESFSDEDDEESGSNDRKLNAVQKMAPAQYIQVSNFTTTFNYLCHVQIRKIHLSIFITKSGPRLI
jgi:hypothetical protein